VLLPPEQHDPLDVGRASTRQHVGDGHGDPAGDGGERRVSHVVAGVEGAGQQASSP
jgi:hypothetical protein